MSAALNAVSTSGLASRPLSVRGHLGVFTIALTGPILLFAAVLLWLLATGERTRLEGEASTVTREVAVSIDRDLISLFASLDTLSLSPSLASGDLVSFRAQAAQLAERQAIVPVLIDLAGQQLINTRVPVGVALPKTQIPWTTAEAATGRPFVTGSFVGAVVGRPLFAVAIGVNVEGKLRYLLSFSLETERLRRILEDARVPVGWTLSVVDRQNILLARSFDHDRFVGKAAPSDFIAATAGSSGTWFGTALDGSRIFGSFARSRISDFRVGVGVRASDLNAPLWRSAALFASLGLALLLLSLGLALFFGRRITTPIAALAQQALALGRLEPVGGLATNLAEVNRVGAELTQASARLRERTSELRDSEALKAAILEAAPDCIITITDEGRIVEFNPAAERTFGHAREAALGRPLADMIIPPEHRATDREGLARHLETGLEPVLGQRIELVAFRADESRFPAELAITAVAIGGTRRFTAYLRDITERRQAEAELLESNAEMQRFAYIVSHDLRSPLVNIMGFTAELETLRDELLERLAQVRQDAAGVGIKPEPDAAETALASDFGEAIGFIKASISKMDRLISAVLSLSREGRRSFKPEPVDMDALMAEIVASMAHQAEQADATVIVSPLPPVSSDRLALDQIFSNLVDNALKYLRKDVPGRIEIDARATAAGLSYEVRDNGRGIEPKDRERVFDLFRRSGVQDRPGEGIGLAHVRTLVRRLGGSIALSSEPGQGSVFTVTLPRRWIGEGQVKS